MQRWNDKIRPVELREIDKQAHKMIIAYVLAKIEEKESNRQINWIEIIEGCIFEYFQRLVLTDLKPEVFYKLKRNADRYRKLNEWVISELQDVLSPVKNGLFDRFKEYLVSGIESLNRKIITAAHFFATQWEFEIIERANPQDYEIQEIKRRLRENQEKNYDLKGMQYLALYSRPKDFINLCGALRFQLRWSHLYIIPRISVLGHMLIVAILCYLFSLELNACERRRVNNFLTGLFHDIPEVLTRDIIDPVKRSVAGIDTLIKKYEKSQLKEKIYRLIPEDWHAEMEMFAEDEFKNYIFDNGKKEVKKIEEINEKYNDNTFNPRDGDIVKAADQLAAFAEAYQALENGIKSQKLEDAKSKIRARYRNKILGGINFGEIYADFE
jgi:putative hydrolase of HD superfamily